MNRIGLIALAFALITTACATAQVVIKKTDDGFVFSEQGQRIMVYRHRQVSLDGKFTRANYIHPLYDLDGNVITEDFPPDHRHHRGIFWAWHQLIVGDRSAGDGWLTQDFEWDVINSQPAEAKIDGSASLSVNVIWKSPTITEDSGKPIPLVNESTSITVHPTQGEIRHLDFEIRLLALLENVSIGGSDDDKGYGGFSARFRLPDDVSFQSPGGSVMPARLATKTEPWIELSASFGKPGLKSGIAMLCHPTSAGYPQRWILRNRESMQNAVYPGREPVPLSSREPLVLRYRLVLHRHMVDPAQVDRWNAQYAKLKF